MSEQGEIRVLAAGSGFLKKVLDRLDGAFGLSVGLRVAWARRDMLEFPLLGELTKVGAAELRAVITH